MTTQATELLVYRGREYCLTTQPLDWCQSPDVRERKGLFQMASTALRRGYSGTWEIKGGRLWLVGLDAWIRHYTSATEWQLSERGLSWLFPDAVGPVLADWFTGTLESPRGKVVFSGTSVIGWPQTRVFQVAAGVVTDTDLRDNRPALREWFTRRAKAMTDPE